ncbi:hypothetical protein Tco_0901112 [Tanacetum coccineum]
MFLCFRFFRFEWMVIVYGFDVSRILDCVSLLFNSVMHVLVLYGFLHVAFIVKGFTDSRMHVWVSLLSDSSMHGSSYRFGARYFEIPCLGFVGMRFANACLKKSSFLKLVNFNTSSFQGRRANSREYPCQGFAAALAVLITGASQSRQHGKSGSPYDCRVTIRSKLKMIPNIKERISSSKKLGLSKSVDSDILFDIDGRTLLQGRAEFCLVTGFACRKVVFPKYLDDDIPPFVRCLFPDKLKKLEKNKDGLEEVAKGKVAQPSDQSDKDSVTIGHHGELVPG